MTYGGSGNTGDGWSGPSAPNYQHAFDPWLEPELFRGVLMRRAIAFIIDLFVLAVPIALAVLFIAVFGLVTLGLGWALFWLVMRYLVVHSQLSHTRLPHPLHLVTPDWQDLSRYSK